MYRLNLLGGASIEGPEGPLDGAIAQRQRLAFLAVLSATPTGLVSRDKLLALLWPEHDAGRARRALSNALYVIKKELGEESVAVVGDDLRLDTEAVAVDALEFEAVAEAGRFQEAVALYAGPYLDGIHVKDAHEFEKWADGERDRLAGMYADALERLAGQAHAQGDLRGAAEWWQKLAVTDPYSSRIALRLMEALARSGDPAGALRYAQVHSTLLQDEFDAGPDPAVTEMVDRLKQDGPVEVRSSGPSLEVAPGPEAESAPAKAPTSSLGAPPPGTALARAGAPPDLIGTFGNRVGRQRVRGPELLIIATLLVIAVGVIYLVGFRGDGSLRPEPTGGPAAPDGILTIAVLPFENFSPNPEDTYFADGMHEEILTKLSRIDSLRVISRSSVMQFRDDRPTAKEIAFRLGADYLLEGSARIAGGSVRLTAQLIDPETDDHIWAADFDQRLDLDSLFVVQGLIADSVAARTRTTLTPDDRDQIRRRPTDNLAAYELYWHGRFLWNQRTEPQIRQAIELFQNAISLDSMYAYAHLGIADAYLTLQSWDWMTFDEAMPLAEEALHRALAIDSLMGEAHASMGVVLESQADIPGAIAAFQRSFELSPDHATGHNWFALLLAKIGYFDDARVHIRYAAELDPLSRTIDVNSAQILHLSRDHASAVAHLEGVTERYPDFTYGWTLLGEAHAALGQYEDALAAVGRAVEIAPWPNLILTLAWVHAMAGDSDQARALLEQAEEGFDRSDPLRRAQVHGALGETDLALQFLEEAIEIRTPTVPYLGVDPKWDPIREDPGFQAILRRLGFIEGET